MKILNAARDQRGVIIIGAYIITLFFLTVSLAVAEFGLQHYTNTRRTLVAVNALQAAEAGADRFMYEINKDSTYIGTNNAPSGSSNSCDSYTSSPVTLANNSVEGKLTYETCVKAGSLINEKIVYSTGKVYLPASSSKPLVTRKLRLIIQSSGTAGYTVQTGNGGLSMTNSASVGSGDFYINGRLTMSNSSTVGDASLTKQSRLWVAGMACGSGASYPSLCAGTDYTNLPIYIDNPQAHIYADVHSPNMTGGGTDGSSTRSRMTNGGLIDANASVIALPGDGRSTIMGRNAWTATAATNGDCPKGQKTSTWAAGTHFTGSVTVSGQCVVTVAGDIWIDGGLSLQNQASLKVADSVSTSPYIIIDGSYGFQPINNTSMQANASGTAFQVETFWSSAGPCPNSAPSVCPTPTGSNLQTSTNTNTIVLSNTFVAPGASFYSVWSGLLVNNATNIGRLIGQKVNLNNSGTITFSPTSVGSSGGTWDVKYYEQIYQ